jgi:hypothetical protein
MSKSIAAMIWVNVHSAELIGDTPMTGQVSTIDPATAAELQRHWDEGWNGEDVDTIMAPFADDIVFSSPFIPRVSGDPAKTTIEGSDALRSYVAHALERTPGIRYTVDATYVGTDTIVLVYTCYLPNDTIKKGADSMRVDPNDKVVEWRCHYSLDSMG